MDNRGRNPLARRLPAALLVLGSAACANDVSRDLRSVGFSPELVLGLEAADVVASRAIRRAAEKLGKGLDVPDIIVLGLGAEGAVRHILQHTATQIGDGLVTHRRLLS